MKRTPVFSRSASLTRHLALGLALALAGMSPFRSHCGQAATQTWTGGTDTDFENAGNWLVTTPSNSTTADIALFQGAVTANQPSLTVSRSINALQFTTATGGWTLGSNSGSNVLGIGANGISSTNTSGTNTISANLNIGAGQTWVSGTGGALLISGTLTGGSALQIGAAANSAGTYIFTGVNSGYSGQVTLNSGTLSLGNKTALGTGTILWNGVSVSASSDLTGANPIANTSTIGGNNTFIGSNSIELSGTQTLTGSRQITNSITSGTLTLSNTVTNSAAATLTVTGSGNTLLSGNIINGTGNTALTKSGSGTLVLSGSNGYTGDTTLNTTVQYQANGSNTVSGTSAAMSASSKLVLNTGALVQLRADSDTTFTTSTYNPNGGTTTTIDVGALTTGSNNTITLRSTNSYSVGGSGTMTLNVTGSNADRLVLSSPVTASHVVNSTIWKLNPTTANVTVANNLNSSATTPTLNLDGTSSDNRFTGNISGTEQVTKSNSSTWTLSGSNTYTGITTVSVGVLQFQANAGNTVSGTSAAMSASSQLSANSGTVQLRADADTTFVTSKLAPTGGATATFDVGAISTGSANSLTLKSTQTWLVGGGPGVSGTPTVMTFNVTGANSDRLVIDSASGQSAQFADSFNTFVLNPTTANLTFASNLTTISAKNNDVLSLSGTSSNNIFSGNISGNPVSAISVTKTNASTWTLSGSNSYAGATSVTGGKLIVSGSLTATASASVSTGAELNVNGLINTASTATVDGKLSGTGTVGAVTVNNTGTLSPGNSAGIINTGNVTLSGSTAHLAIELGKTTAGSPPVVGIDYDQVAVTGAISLTNSDLVLTLNSGIEDGDLFTIMLNSGTGDAVTGVFASVNGVSTSLNQGDQFTVGGMQLQISYRAEGATFDAGAGLGNDVALLVVPEPNTFMMLLGGIGFLSFWQRARRRNG